MKILIVGSDKVWAIERFYHKYLNELGASTEFFLAQSVFYDYYGKSIINKIIFKLGLSPIYKIINKQFREVILANRPDVIFIFKGMEVFPSTINWAKQQGIRVVGYNPDNPFLFTGKGSGNKNVTDSIALYDLHFTYNTSIQKQIEKEYKLPVIYLPFGFELSEDLYEKCKAEQEVVRVCFLGNPDPDRAKFINSIAEAGIPIDLYGNDWNKFVNHQNIRVFSPIYGDEFWRTLRKYRVQLNLMRVHNPDSHNMRSFEVPGIGGIMLAPDTLEHRGFFEPDKEVFLFSDQQTCIQKIKYLISLDQQGAGQIRDRARARSLSSGYTYKDRAAQVLKALKELS
ncbi:hypothetical protein EXU57_17705 [Segetibacter sp. 3557_3]|uniref:CgeB family protein n=1 Tax=Segetibacter sp. 3557_3 TaxID=2547429 RepID=UPI001058AC20|nr:glycosyltransferase [Segetibacter sp. 3557_3]TDH23308.1 hypothetical protein EXU57_17705 [Segetibacter sp. 3557_3]